MEKVRLQTKILKHEKINEMVQFTGILLQEGIFTDAYGRTLRYTPELIDSIKGFVGRPIILPHTDGSNDMRKVVGTITETWVDDFKGKKSRFYKGLVHDNEAGFRILAGDISGNSIEADFDASNDTDPPTVTSLVGDAVALTNTPACDDCRIQGSPKTIKLNKGGKKMTGEPKPQKNPGETLEEVKQLLSKIDVKEETPWTKMSKQERYGACDMFFKKHGYPLPVKHAKKVKDDISGKETWEFPENFPEETKETILNLEKQVVKLTEKVTNLSDNIKTRDTDEVRRLFNDIKELDPEFDQESVTRMTNDLNHRKLILSNYLENLKRIKPSVQDVAPPGEDKRMKKILMEAFGVSSAEELEASMGVE